MFVQLNLLVYKLRLVINVGQKNKNTIINF
jgi:hypothetical protein